MEKEQRTGRNTKSPSARPEHLRVVGSVQSFHGSGERETYNGGKSRIRSKNAHISEEQSTKAEFAGSSKRGGYSQNTGNSAGMQRRRAGNIASQEGRTGRRGSDTAPNSLERRSAGMSDADIEEMRRRRARSLSLEASRRRRNAENEDVEYIEYRPRRTGKTDGDAVGRARRAGKTGSDAVGQRCSAGAAGKASAGTHTQGVQAAGRRSASARPEHLRQSAAAQDREAQRKRRAQKARIAGKGRNVRNARKEQIIRYACMGGGVLVAAVLVIFLCVKLIGKIPDKKKAAPKTVEAVAEAVTPIPETLEEEVKDFQPRCTENTKPSNLIDTTEINLDGNTLASISDYTPAAPISFGKGSDYTDLEGIITFRGNNYRNAPSYGFANMKDHTLQKLWSCKTDSLSSGSATWTGSGWTGQPLIVKWPKETKAVMNMYDWAKADDDLVEVIYACMDGYIYFLDLETGKPTRDTLYLGYTFKGSGALDPRGYPIMYVGAGYNSNEGTARAFIINLLDCSVLYTFGNEDSFSLRGSLSFFDSSALVAAEADTLIYPGENGILYLMKLNTQYDEKAGTLSINPSNIVKWRYNGTRSSNDSYWLGMEDSAVILGNHLFVADNGGNFMCIDLNTLELVWVQDTLDDTNCTPVLSVEDGHPYLYISTSFHLGWRSYDSAEIPIWKIDAETGEIVWKVPYECGTMDGVSGGVQSTIAVGGRNLSDYIYVTVSMTGGALDGVLACIDKKSGEVVWEHNAAYAWSSPVCVYNDDGSGNVLYCSSGGKMYLLDGKTGQEYNAAVLSEGVIEASPAVYNNMAVVGTRDCEIWGIKLG